MKYLEVNPWTRQEFKGRCVACNIYWTELKKGKKEDLILNTKYTEFGR